MPEHDYNGDPDGGEDCSPDCPRCRAIREIEQRYADGWSEIMEHVVDLEARVIELAHAAPPALVLIDWQKLGEELPVLPGRGDDPRDVLKDWKDVTILVRDNRNIYYLGERLSDDRSINLDGLWEQFYMRADDEWPEGWRWMLLTKEATDG